MATTLTGKGQVIIPQQIREAPHPAPGCSAEFTVHRKNNVVIHEPGARPGRNPDRFESARGKADVKCGAPSRCPCRAAKPERPRATTA